MRDWTVIVTATAAILIGGCAGNATPSATAQSNRSGIDPHISSRPAIARRETARASAKKAFTELAVSNGGAVDFFNSAYEQHGKISNGIDQPEGNFIDGAGNLYVAQYAVPNVVEYAKGAKAPSVTYTDGLTDPVAVTTDAAQNVYVANFAAHGPGPVVEYAQGSNVAIANCDSGLANTGIAVDSKGDVFVMGNNPFEAGRLVEYKHGLKNCKATELGAQFSFAGGLQIDKKGNLVACDQQVGVDIVPPPYDAIAATITGATDTFQDALSKDNSLLFIADPNGHQLLVDEYPSGAPVTALGASSGVGSPFGVATYPYQKKIRGK